MENKIPVLISVVLVFVALSLLLYGMFLWYDYTTLGNARISGSFNEIEHSNQYKEYKIAEEKLTWFENNIQPCAVLIGMAGFMIGTFCIISNDKRGV